MRVKKAHELRPGVPRRADDGYAELRLRAHEDYPSEYCGTLTRLVVTVLLALDLSWSRVSSPAFLSVGRHVRLCPAQCTADGVTDRAGCAEPAAAVTLMTAS